MAYTDLNPVRAGMAEDLESSDYTSIQQRFRETARRLGDIDKLIEPVAGVRGPLSLGISIRHHLGLIDWIGRFLHPNKSGKIEAGVPSALASLGINTDSL